MGFFSFEHDIWYDKTVFDSCRFFQLASFVDRIHKQGTSSLTRPMLAGRRTFPAKNPRDQSMHPKCVRKEKHGCRQVQGSVASQTSWSSFPSFLQKLFFHHFKLRKEILEKISESVYGWLISSFLSSLTLKWIFKVKKSISLAVLRWVLCRLSRLNSFRCCKFLCEFCDQF